MPPGDREFCSEVSTENSEPLAATASRVDHWVLVEYRGLWSHDALVGSGLSDQVKAHLRGQAAARGSPPSGAARRSAAAICTTPRWRRTTICFSSI